MKKLLAGILSGLALGAAPIVPQNMKFVEANQMDSASLAETIRQFDNGLVASTSIAYGKTLPPAYREFTDEDGNGRISFAVFANSEGTPVYIQIPDAQYADMGGRKEDGKGSVRNPDNRQFVSAWRAISSPAPAEAAIAFDAAVVGTVSLNVTSKTIAVTTNGGANSLLFAGDYAEPVGGGGGETLTGITYNAVALTQINKKIRSNGVGWLYLYYLAGPATGANNLVASYSANTHTYLAGANYTGAAQIGIPDAQATSAAAGNDEEASVTVVGSTCWIAGYGLSDNGGVGAGTNMTSRGTAGASTIFGDTAAIVGPGAVALGIVGTGSGNQIINAASFCEPAAASAAPQPVISFE